MSSGRGYCMPKGTYLWAVLTFQSLVYKPKVPGRARAPPSAWPSAGSDLLVCPSTAHHKCLSVLAPRFQRTVGATSRPEIYVRCFNLTFIRVRRAGCAINWRVVWWLFTIPRDYSRLLSISKDCQDKTWSLVKYCGGQNNGPPKMSMSYFQEPVTMLGYMANGN